MSIQTMRITVTGINPLLVNNPQTVDTTNEYTKKISKITKKRAKTEEDIANLRDLEIRAKIYWEDDAITIPTTWLTSAIHARSFKLEKISKADSRSAVFAVSPNAKLRYAKMNSVKKPEDIVKNHYFRHAMTLKQGQVRICKAMPIFHDWSFETELEFDDTIYDFDVLKNIITNAASYGGFGDFRPTFGRAKAEVELVQ